MPDVKLIFTFRTRQDAERALEHRPNPLRNLARRIELREHRPELGATEITVLKANDPDA